MKEISISKEKEMVKTKKKTNIALFTVIMTIVFFIITQYVIWGKASTGLITSILKYPYGSTAITEFILTALVLILMLSFGNSYVFTQKREKVTKGLYYGLFYIIFAGIMILLAIFIAIIPAFSENSTNALFSILNLLISCFLIGMAEEFLCRGWLLNEFLERFGDNKKGVYGSVWYSIIISGLIFGVMHLANIYSGRSLTTTIVQVFSAAATGIVFGLIYYKTKNIWSVVILHGLWDFSLMLLSIAPEMTTSETTLKVTIISSVFSVLLVVIELLNIIPHTKNIDKEPKRKSVITFAIVTAILYFVCFFMSANGVKTVKKYNFETINIPKYAIINDNYDNYFIEYVSGREVKGFNGTSHAEKVLIEVSKNNENNIVLTNVNTKYSIEFECEKLIDYRVMEQDDYYVFAYIDYRDSMNPFLKYVYINKYELSNNNEFLNKLKDNIKEYVLPDYKMSMFILNDRENSISYLGVTNNDIGTYLLISEDKMAKLN